MALTGLMYYVLVADPTYRVIQIIQIRHFQWLSDGLCQVRIK